MHYFFYHEKGEVKSKILAADDQTAGILSAKGMKEVSKDEYEACRLKRPEEASPSDPFTTSAPEPPALTDHERIEALERELMELKARGR